MAKKDIFCVGLDVPGEEFNYVPFHSGASLLDADIILFEVGLDYITDSSRNSYQGKPSLSAESSIQNRASITHWRNELKQAFEIGKTIFIFLKKPTEVYARTGSQEISGTGRGQRVIHHVDLINSYSSLPINFDSIIPSKGKKVKFTKDGGILSGYWKGLNSISHYEVYYEHQKSKVLLITKSGDKTLASLIHGKKGAMFLLPPVDFSSENFVHYDEKKYQSFWTTEALKYGKTLLKSIVEIHKTLQRGFGKGPAPEWVSNDKFILKVEKDIDGKIEAINSKLSKLSEQRINYQKKLEIEKLPKCLLYETGKALEAAVIDALHTIGFKADKYKDEESEFDILFESEEGRFLGEVEGKDNSAININKLQQLERNIQEDFSKEHVDAYAKGVLFGNPNRLTEPKKRDTLFTKKALSAAKRSGFALVHTPDLFPIVQYLKEKKNKTFSKKVRKRFAKVSGDIISFPAVPRSQKVKSTEPTAALDDKKACRK
jgi:hypothetical protein